MNEKYFTIGKKIDKIVQYMYNNFYINFTDKELYIFFSSEKTIDLNFLSAIESTLADEIRNRISKYNINKPIYKLKQDIFHDDIGLFYFLFLMYIRSNYDQIRIFINNDVVDYNVITYKMNDPVVELFRPNMPVGNSGMLMKYLVRAQTDMLVISKPMKMHLFVLQKVLNYVSKEQLLKLSSKGVAVILGEHDILLSVLFLVQIAYSSEIMTSKRKIHLDIE
ncbi:MAG: hypothetical protein QW255_04770 [Candidatus Bilamarchaeaceae archaeon]